MARNNIGGISGRPLHGDLDFLRRRQDKVALDNGTCKIVELFEDIFASVVEIGLPVPGGMAAGTGGAEDEESGVGGPLSFLDVASVFAIGAHEIFGCDHAVLAVMDFDSGFVEGRPRFADREKAGAQCIIRRSDSWTFPCGWLGTPDEC